TGAREELLRSWGPLDCRSGERQTCHEVRAPVETARWSSRPVAQRPCLSRPCCRGSTCLERAVTPRPSRADRRLAAPSVHQVGQPTAARAATGHLLLQAGPVARAAVRPGRRGGGGAVPGARDAHAVGRGAVRALRGAGPDAGERAAAPGANAGGTGAAARPARSAQRRAAVGERRAGRATAT